MPRYQRLNYEKRVKLASYTEEGLTQKEMALRLGINQSSVSRELRRNKGLGNYEAEKAQRLSEIRKRAEKPKRVLTEDLKKKIKQKLHENWSPEQIAGRFRLEGIQVSVKTIYRYIREDQKSGGKLYLLLRHKGKPYRKRGFRASLAGRGVIPNRVDIKERPAEVNQKERLGDWEGDTVVGKGHQGGVLTLVDRSTKFTEAFLLKSRKAQEITEKIKTLRKKKDRFKTITFDNGKEFSNHEKISQILEAPCYFATPYRSCERGLNEHTNGLLREYFPKKTEFHKVSQSDIDKVLRKINNRPRKELNFLTPREALLLKLKESNSLCTP